jgi:hypothetical protein
MAFFEQLWDGSDPASTGRAGRASVFGASSIACAGLPTPEPEFGRDTQHIRYLGRDRYRVMQNARTAAVAWRRPWSRGRGRGRDAGSRSPTSGLA